MQDVGKYWSLTLSQSLSRRAALRGGLAVAGAASLAGAACSTGKSSGNGAKQTSGAQSNTSDSGLKAGSFKTGGNLQIQGSSIGPLDPYTSTAFITLYPISHSYSRLFRFIASTDPTVFTSHQIAPELVDTYEISPDATTYTMKLRKNAMFHPPLSRPLTSADVEASFRRLTEDPKSVNAGAFKPFVDSLTTPDDSTVVFKLKAPYAPFLNKLASANYFWVISKDAVDGGIDPAKQVVGTGPFIFAGTTPTAISFKKNPDYYIKGLPYVDGVVVNIMLDFATREAQFQAGRIDVDQLANLDVDAMKKAVPKAHIASYSDVYGSYLFFYDVTAPDSPFKDIRVRQAVSLAIDRKGLLEAGYNGEGSWNNLVNPGLGKWWLDPQSKDIGDAGKWFKHDPAQAKQLLAAAGHANTEFKYLYPNNSYTDPYNTLADATRGMLADAGFKLTAVTIDYNKDYMNSGQGYYYKGAPPNGMIYALGPTRWSDADEYLNGMLTVGGQRNQSHVNDPNLEAMVRKEQAELDESKRVALARDVQKAHADQLYYVPGVGQIRYDIYQSWIDNPIVTNEYSWGLERSAYLSINKT
jgi:peptide/nickel transport system substrate-binding protein